MKLTTPQMHTVATAIANTATQMHDPDKDVNRDGIVALMEKAMDKILDGLKVNL